MVKVKDATRYECEVCHKRHWKEEEALKCESKPAMKYELPFYGTQYQHDWNIGEFIILYPSKSNMCMKRRVPVLAKIIGETVVRHSIVPLLEFLDTRAFNYPGSKTNSYSKACWGKAVLFTDDVKEMLEEWLAGLNED